LYPGHPNTRVQSFSPIMDKIADTSPAAKPAKITPDYTFLRRA
jgi:hypothetical protein